MKISLGLGSLALSLLLVGCGGGSHSVTSTKAKAQATLKVIWPDRDARLIPLAANSITVDILDHGTGTTIAEATVARPASGNTSETDFNDLSVGNFDVSVKAFPTTDGTGTAQAVGAGSMTTQLDTPALVNVSLASTATAISISPSSPRVGKGTTQSLTASATDASGNIVLLSAGGGTESLVWATDNSAVATVTGTGPTATLNGLTAGTVHVTATLTTDDNGSTLTGTGTPTIVAATGTVIVH